MWSESVNSLNSANFLQSHARSIGYSWHLVLSLSLFFALGTIRSSSLTKCFISICFTFRWLASTGITLEWAMHFSELVIALAYKQVCHFVAESWVFFDINYEILGQMHSYAPCCSIIRTSASPSSVWSISFVKVGNRWVMVTWLCSRLPISGRLSCPTRILFAEGLLGRNYRRKVCVRL